LSQSRQYMNRHSKTAIKICGAAAVVATAWISAGFMFHDQVMEAANEKERELAAEVHWDTKKNPLYVVKHPNNKTWAAKQKQKVINSSS